MNRKKYRNIHSMVRAAFRHEIEVQTAESWLSTGAIAVVEYGNENTYYIDQFNNEFYCKNYPGYGERQRHENPIPGEYTMEDQPLLNCAIQALRNAFGDEWHEFTLSKNAGVQSLVINDFIEANIPASEYLARIHRGNLASYARTLVAQSMRINP